MSGTTFFKDSLNDGSVQFLKVNNNRFIVGDKSKGFNNARTNEEGIYINK